MADLKGFPFPIYKNPLGFLYTQIGAKNLKSDLIQLILTNPGDRVMLPQYGTALRKYIFEQNTDTTKDAISAEISNSISTWEPRITVTAITVTDLVEKTEAGYNSTNKNGVLIRINYINPEKINIIEELVLAVPFEGG
jgi:phage baseplate assembly protein W